MVKTCIARFDATTVRYTYNWQWLWNKIVLCEWRDCICALHCWVLVDSYRISLIQIESNHITSEHIVTSIGVVNEIVSMVATKRTTVICFMPGYCYSFQNGHFHCSFDNVRIIVWNAFMYPIRLSLSLYRSTARTLCVWEQMRKRIM